MYEALNYLPVTLEYLVLFHFLRTAHQGGQAMLNCPYVHMRVRIVLCDPGCAMNSVPLTDSRLIATLKLNHEYKTNHHALHFRGTASAA